MRADKTKLCNYCSPDHVYSQNTANATLAKHTETKHPEHVPEVKQLTLMAMPNMAMSKTRKDLADQAMIDWIVVNFQSFMVVENVFFTKFLTELNPAYTPIVRQTVSNRIVKSLPETKASIQGVLTATPGRITCTTDGWTDRSMVSYLATTAHWISKQ